MFTPIGIRYALAWVVALAPGTAMASCELVERGGLIQSTLALRAVQITVGRDIAVGTEVYRQVFNLAGNSAIRCAPGVDDISVRRSVETPAAAIPGYQTRAGGSVYPTNLAGIGVQILDADNRPFPSITRSPNCPGSEGCVLRNQGLDKFTLSFIKVSTNVEAGAISSATLPTVLISYDIRGQQLPVRKVRLSGLLRVASQTCRTPHVQVNLGRHPISELEHLGYTPWQDFGIALNQCPGFHGYYSAGAVGGEPGVVLNPNKVTFRIDPTQPAVSNEEGILSLTPGLQGAVKAAQGIGVQIAQESAQPIKLSTLLDSGLSLQSNEGGSYLIRLKARYIKQANAVAQSGPANATVTFTINYQ